MNSIQKSFRNLLGNRIKGARIFPIATKIILIFIIFILMSNFASHYISLMLYRGEMVRLAKQLLVRDLKELYSYSNTQHEIFQVNSNLRGSLSAIERKALLDFRNRNSLLLGIQSDGTIMMQTTRGNKARSFSDRDALQEILSTRNSPTPEGFTTFSFNGKKYFGVYKYNSRWKLYLIRAEEFNEFNEESARIFKKIIIIIIMITAFCAVVGVYIMGYILRYIGFITNAILAMTRSKKLDIINLEDGHADDITFLGVAFNSLSSTVNNLLTIFQKFTNRDIVVQAYEEREIRLEGSRRELTILFSDIRSFTYMTEVLGTEIITLINLHYTHVISEILRNEGIIGSIIGDALLAVYGVFDNSADKKSYQSIVTAYRIHEIAADIRTQMTAIKEKIVSERGAMTPMEEKVYQAVLIDVGVGIDGGMVFYGNIGSHERMTNTVIGDNVNSSSRLEGLTRIYNCPVICSEYIMNDIEQHVPDHGIVFLELDTVKVKGKTEGKKVYWPIVTDAMTRKMAADIRCYKKGLDLYYRGNWKSARSEFSKCDLPMAPLFLKRTEEKKPRDWNGIWTMETK